MRRLCFILRQFVTGYLKGDTGEGEFLGVGACHRCIVFVNVGIGVYKSLILNEFEESKELAGLVLEVDMVERKVVELVLLECKCVGVMYFWVNKL